VSKEEIPQAKISDIGDVSGSIFGKAVVVSV